MTTKPPNPGSDEAVSAGCTCPVLDNNHGAGIYTTENGVTAFVFDTGCPLHGEGNWAPRRP